MRLSPEERDEIMSMWDWTEDQLASQVVPEAVEREISERLERISTRSIGGSRHGPKYEPISPDELPKKIFRAIRARGHTLLRNFADGLERSICDEMDYCEKKKILAKEGPVLAITVADALLSASIQIPLPITAVSVYLVKAGVLDRLCECE